MAIITFWREFLAEWRTSFSANLNAASVAARSVCKATNLRNPPTLWGWVWSSFSSILQSAFGIHLDSAPLALPYPKWAICFASFWWQIRLLCPTCTSAGSRWLQRQVLLLECWLQRWMNSPSLQQRKGIVNHLKSQQKAIDAFEYRQTMEKNGALL